MKRLYGEPVSRRLRGTETRLSQETVLTPLLHREKKARMPVQFETIYNKITMRGMRSALNLR